MSVVFSGTLQGNFTATGNAVTLNVPTGVDYIYVYDLTNIASGTGAVQFYWQLGMNQGQGVTWTASTGAVSIANITAGDGFFLVNNTINIPSAPRAVSAVSTATPPVVSAGNTTGLIAGQSIVRMYATAGAEQLASLDFTVGTVVGSTSFQLKYMATLGGAGTTGSYALIPYDAYWYPPYRFITAITQASQAVVTLSVNHNFTVGQTVRMVVPSAYGMPQMNGLQADIVAITTGSTNTITLDIDSSGFSAFAFPATAAGFTFSPAMVVPIGENTAVALTNNQNILADSTTNEGEFGITLQGGAGNPGGAQGDVMYWVAGKSFSNSDGHVTNP